MKADVKANLSLPDKNEQVITLLLKHLTMFWLCVEQLDLLTGEVFIWLDVTVCAMSKEYLMNVHVPCKVKPANKVRVK